MEELQISRDGGDDLADGARKAVAELLENNETGFSSDDEISAGEAFDDIMNQAAAISAANGS